MGVHAIAPWERQRLVGKYKETWREAWEMVQKYPVFGQGLGTFGALTAILLQRITDFGLYIPAVALVAAVLIGLNFRARSLA